MSRRRKMNENAHIIIDGTIVGDDESRITAKAKGHYQKLDDVHVLRYFEQADSGEGPGLRDTASTIRIAPGLVEMIKRGEDSTHMVFDLSCPTQSVYDTPYGSLYFQIKTQRIDISEGTDRVAVHLEYSLFHDESHISDNRVDITIDKI